MNNISLTVPFEHAALTRAAAMLTGLAEDYKQFGPIHGELVTASVEDIKPIQHTIADSIKLPAGLEVAKTTVEVRETANPVITGGNVVVELTAIATYDNPDPTLPDHTGLRWDIRIHPKSHLIIKKTGDWKLIKQIDPNLVAQVRKEQAAIVAGAAVDNGLAFEIGADGQAQQVAADPVQQIAQLVQGQQPVQQLAANQVAVHGGVMTTALTPEQIAAQTQQQIDDLTTEKPIDFAGLMGKISQRQIARPDFGEIVKAVLLQHNIASLPALFPFTDLIPTIDKELDALWLG